MEQRVQLIRLLHVVFTCSRERGGGKIWFTFLPVVLHISKISRPLLTPGFGCKTNEVSRFRASQPPAMVSARPVS